MFVILTIWCFRVVRCCWRIISGISPLLVAISLIFLCFEIVFLYRCLPKIDLQSVCWSQFIEGAQNLSWLNFLLALPLLVVPLAFGVKISRDRKRILFKEVIDYTGDNPKSADAWRFRLLAEFLRLARLYSAVAELGPIPAAVHRDAPLSAKIGVIEVSELLKSAQTTGSRLKLGSIEIPLDWLSRLWSLLVVRPTMIGTVYKQGDKRVFSIQMTREGQTRTWRVERSTAVSDSLKPEKQDFVEDMIQEMACRILTELSRGPSSSWRAVRDFNKGLACYRESLETAEPKKLLLIEAEQRLLAALNADGKFGLAYYNLGVIYLQLNNHEAALSAFLHGIELLPQRWEPFYGLALVYFHEGEKDKDNYRTVQRLCDRLIELNPSVLGRFCSRFLSPMQPAAVEPLRFDVRQTILARAYDLRSAATRGTDQHDPECLKQVIIERERATSCSRRALYWSMLTDSEMSDASRVTANCLKNLAVALTMLAETGPGDSSKESLLRQAEFTLNRGLKLLNNEAELFLELARVHSLRQEIGKAIKTLESAIAVAPEDGRVWAYLAAGYAIQEGELSAAQAGKRVCGIEERSSEKAFRRFIDHLKEIGTEHLATIKKDLNRMCNDYKASTTPRYQGLQSLMIRVESAIAFWDKWNKQVQTADVPVGDIAAEIGDECLTYRAEIRYTFHESAHDLTPMLLSEKDQMWGRGMCHIRRGHLALEERRAEVAANCFSAAIGLLEKDYPCTLAAWNTKADLVLAHLEKGDELNKAFENAGDALSKNRLQHTTRTALAGVYFAIKDFRRAIEQYESSLLLGANDPKTYLRIGRSWLQVAGDSRDARERRDACKIAEDYFTKSLNLYRIQESGSSNRGSVSRFDLDGMALSHYWLGRVKRQLGQYATALRNFRIAETIKDGNPMLQLCVAQAGLRNKNYEECEEKLRQVSEEGILEKTGFDPKAFPLPEEYGPWLCLRGIRVMARIWLAYSMAERDGDLEEALNIVREARKQIEEFNFESRQKRALEFNCFECQGWILAKQDEIVPAIALLKLAVYRNSCDPEPHLHLATVYEKQARSWPKGPGRQRLISKARTHCTHAIELDFDRKYLDETTKLQNRLRFE